MKKKKEKSFPTKGNKIIFYKTNNPIAEDEMLEQFVFTDALKFLGFKEQVNDLVGHNKEKYLNYWLFNKKISFVFKV